MYTELSRFFNKTLTDTALVHCLSALDLGKQYVAITEKACKQIKVLKEESLSRCKSDLVVIMSRIQNGYVPTSEEVMVLYETKAKYNKLGGDSYIDDMFEKLKKEGKL